jgi:single stranded DNA-binding protein
MSLNFIVLSGTLVQDSEIRYTMSGKPVLEFNLTVVDSQHPDLTQSVRVISRRDNAAEQHARLKRGAAVIVEGQLVQRKLETSSGHRRKQPEIHMDHLTVLDQPHEKELMK